MKRKRRFCVAALCLCVLSAFACPVFSDEPNQDERIGELVYYFFGDVYGSDTVRKPTVNPFDYSLFDIPEGEDVAFYKQRSQDISDSYQTYKDAVRHNGRIADVDLEERLSAESYRCHAYLTQAPDFKRDENAWPGNLYHIGLAYYGKVDELTEELDAELAKEEPDQIRVNTTRHDLTIAETAKAIQENRFDSFLDAKIEQSLADKTPNEAGGAIGALGRLGRFDLRDAAEWRVGKAFAQADVPALSSYVESVGEARRRRCFGKELELEGVFTDGTEFSWDDYRDKAVLVCCVPKTSRPEEEPVNALSAYRAYHDYGLEIVWYAPDDEETFLNGDLLKELPGKVVSQKATRAAKDKDYLDFSLFYCEKNQPSAYLVGKSGKVVGSRVFDVGFLTGPAREYPDAAKAEIERLLKALADKDRDFKSKWPDLALAAELFKTFDPTKEEIDAFAIRLQKALGATNPAPAKPQKQAADITNSVGRPVISDDDDDDRRPAVSAAEIDENETPTKNPFDYSLLEIPEGKKVAFYKNRIQNIRSSYGLYEVAVSKNDKIKDPDLASRINPTFARCRAYMTQAPDFNRYESRGMEELYYAGLAYFGNVDELTKELNAELGKKTPDQVSANMLRRNLTFAETAKAIKENGLDSLIDAKIEKAVADNSPESLEEVSRTIEALESFLGRFDLQDRAEYRVTKAFVQSNVPELVFYAKKLGDSRRFKGAGKELTLEGICSDGKEFSWDDYRGKVVLVYCVPPKPLSRENDMTESILYSYRTYHACGFELVLYSDDVVVDSFGSLSIDKPLPGKTVSRKATLNAKDKNYVDFATAYYTNEYPTAYLVGKDGKMIDAYVKNFGVCSHRTHDWLPALLAREYPEAARAEIERILNVPDGRENEYYLRLIVKEFALAKELFGAFNPTPEELKTFDERVKKAREEALRRHKGLPKIITE